MEFFDGDPANAWLHILAKWNAEASKIDATLIDVLHDPDGYGVTDGGHLDFVPRAPPYDPNGTGDSLGNTVEDSVVEEMMNIPPLDIRMANRILNYATYIRTEAELKVAYPIAEPHDYDHKCPWSSLSYAEQLKWITRPQKFKLLLKQYLQFVVSHKYAIKDVNVNIPANCVQGDKEGSVSEAWKSIGYAVHDWIVRNGWNNAPPPPSSMPLVNQPLGPPPPLTVPPSLADAAPTALPPSQPPSQLIKKPSSSSSSHQWDEQLVSRKIEPLLAAEPTKPQHGNMEAEHTNLVKDIKPSGGVAESPKKPEEQHGTDDSLNTVLTPWPKEQSCKDNDADGDHNNKAKPIAS